MLGPWLTSRPGRSVCLGRLARAERDLAEAQKGVSGEKLIKASQRHQDATEALAKATTERQAADKVKPMSKSTEAKGAQTTGTYSAGGTTAFHDGLRGLFAENQKNDQSVKEFLAELAKYIEKNVWDGSDPPVPPDLLDVKLRSDWPVGVHQ